MYGGTPVVGNAFPYTINGNAFTFTGVLPYTGVPHHMGMHSHVLGHPNIWECIPIHNIWYAFPYTGVPRHMGMHSHIMGYTTTTTTATPPTPHHHYEQHMNTHIVDHYIQLHSTHTKPPPIPLHNPTPPRTFPTQAQPNLPLTPSPTQSNNPSLRQSAAHHHKTNNDIATNTHPATLPHPKLQTTPTESTSSSPFPRTHTPPHLTPHLTPHASLHAHSIPGAPPAGLHGADCEEGVREIQQRSNPFATTGQREGHPPHPPTPNNQGTAEGKSRKGGSVSQTG